MKHILCAGFLLGFAWPSMSQLGVEAGTRFDSTIDADNASGETILAERYFVASGQTGRGQRSLGVQVLYDVSTRRYQWMVEWILEKPDPAFLHVKPQAADPGSVRVYSSLAGIDVFWLSPQGLYVLNAPAEADSLEDAEVKVLKFAESASDAEHFPQLSARWRKVPLAVLSPAFWAGAVQAQIGPLKVLRVIQNGNGWSVTIEGQWKEVITLDDKYQLLRTERVK